MKDDVTALAEAAYAILSDEKRHRDFAAASRERAGGMFSAERVVPRYEAFYRHVIGQGDGLEKSGE